MVTWSIGETFILCCNPQTVNYFYGEKISVITEEMNYTY